VCGVLLYVECSAGVGRTGVLIGMLTACSCIDSGLAVDMLAIVRQLRDQRAVLVQTPVSSSVACLAQLWIYCIITVAVVIAFSALTLLVGRQ